MLICGGALTLLSALVPFAPTFALLVALRAAQGLTIPGITVAGLAYLHNELPAAWRGRVSGFYIAANTIGGLVSRLGVGLFVESIGWRGGAGLVAIWVAIGTLLPLVASASRRRPTAATDDAPPAPPAVQVIRRLWWAPLIGGSVFFPFLSIFSYSTYRLEGPPFNLTATGASLIYLTYLLGAVASPIAGNISDRIGRRPTIQGALAVSGAGLALSLAPSLVIVTIGLTLICVGSLMAHVVANASVSQSANPLGAQARATALSLYTLGFYVGGGLGSFLPGFALVRYGWAGVVALCGVALIAAFFWSFATPARPEQQRAAALEAPTAG
jgi:YNFM family putative membrane transporter